MQDTSRLPWGPHTEADAIKLGLVEAAQACLKGI